jgi:hypothetical protein
MAGGGQQQSAPSQTTTVQKSDPWEGQQPSLMRAITEANWEFNKPAAQYYPGQTVVPFSPETNMALDMQTARALNGSPLQSAANDQLTSTLNGDYLYGGQGFNEAIDAATRKILPAVNGTFEAAGRGRSGLADVAKTQAISDAFANQYSNERTNQQRAMMFAPQVAAMDYQDISKLAEVGTQKESLEQEKVSDAVNRYNYNATANQRRIADFMSLINGNYGGTSTSSSNATQPMYRNTGSSALGGAMSGASMSGLMGINPIVGGLGGLLMGMF